MGSRQAFDDALKNSREYGTMHRSDRSNVNPIAFKQESPLRKEIRSWYTSNLQRRWLYNEPSWYKANML